MLKLRYLQFSFGIILVLLAVCVIFMDLSPLWFIGTLLVLIILLAAGSANIKSGMYCKVLYKGDRNKKTVALTFDDGPDATLTPAILDILNKESVSAAFFCIGKKASENPGLLARMDNEGHLIGGHSYSHHFLFDLLSSRKMADEMQKSEEIIFKEIKKRIKCFRPPYGVTNPPLARALAEKKYHAIGWSLRTMDTVIRDENRLLDKVKKKLKSGDIILFHDTNERTANILGEFIKFAKNNGFSLERLDHHLGIEAYENE